MNCALCLNPDANHSTWQHERVVEEAKMCIECDAVITDDDPEVTRCTPCWQEWKMWLREDGYDHLAKGDGSC